MAFCRNKRRKHLPPKSMCHEPHVSMDKSQSYMSGNISLYPCPSNEPNLQQDVNKEGRLLWATLTPHGTRHFVTAARGGVERYPNYDDHYEIIDYHNRPVVRTREGTPRKVPIKVKDFVNAFILKLIILLCTTCFPMPTNCVAFTFQRKMLLKRDITLNIVSKVKIFRKLS